MVLSIEERVFISAQRLPERNVYEFGINNIKSRPRNRWQHELREDGRVVGKEVWQEEVYNIEELKKLLNGKESSHSVHANIMNE
jgi:hypothetical protein